MSAAQRARLLDAAAWACIERGAGRVTVADLILTAGVSRTTYYREFSDAEDCLAEAFAAAAEMAAERAQRAAGRHEDWRAALRAGLAAVLSFFDEHPQLGHLCIAEAFALGERAARHRERVLARAEAALEHGRRPGAGPPGELTARALAGGAWWVAHLRLRDPEGGPLLGLLGELTALLLAPYEGPEAAAAELARPAPQPPPASPRAARPLRRPPIRMTHRTMEVLATVGEHPGISNRGVVARTGISDQGQASKLLKRLAHAGLLVNRGAGQQRGEANAWHLTSAGRDLDERLRRLTATR